MIGTALDSQKTTITLMVSAFWHGVYPGYYLTFFFMSYGRDASYLIYKQVDPWMKQRFGEGSLAWHVYDVLLRVYTIWSASYCIIPFMRYEFVPSLMLFARTWFLGVLSNIVIFYTLKFFPIYPKQKPNKPTPQQSLNKED